MITTHLNEFLLVNQKAVSLMEMVFSGYTKYDNLTVFFSKQRKPSIAILRKGNRYDVLFFKQGRMGLVLYNILGMGRGQGVSDEKIFDLMLEKSKEVGLLKKFHSNLTGPKLIDLLIVKSGVQTEVLKDIFPDIDFEEKGVKTQIGKFNIIGLSKKNEKIVESLIDKSSDLIRKAGYGHILYGDVVIVTRGSISQRAAADYGEKSDNIRLKLPVKIFDHAVQSLIHELGHRQYYKFKTDQTAVHRRWLQATSKYPILRIGDRVKEPDSDREFSVTGIKSIRSGNVKYQGYYMDDPGRKLIASDHIALWDKLTGESDRDVLSVSRYAMSNEREFYAEVFAHGVLGNKNALQWIKEVSSK